MRNFPTNKIMEMLCEDATREDGWLSDGLYETAEPDEDTGTITLDNGNSIDLYALVDVVRKAIEESEEY